MRTDPLLVIILSGSVATLTLVRCDPSSPEAPPGPPAAGPAAGTSAPERAGEARFDFPRLPSAVTVGEPLRLAVRPLAEGSWEYRWHVKRGSDPWEVVRPWSPDPGVTLRPEAGGSWAVQVDVRETQVVARKWLGQMVVRKPLVDGFTTLPPASALAAGTPFRFLVTPLEAAPLDSLEFRVLEVSDRGETVRTLRDWGPWPVPPLAATARGYVILWMEVRERADPDALDRHPLGEFYISAGGAGGADGTSGAGRANLLRNLIADDFGSLDDEAAVAKLASELWLAVHILEQESDGAAPDTLAPAIRSLLPRAEVRTPADGGPIEVTMPAGATGTTGATGATYRIDPASRAFEEVGSPVSLRLDIEHYPRYREVFRVTRDLPPGRRMVAALTFAVYEGYHFGDPGHGRLRHPAQIVSHCGSQSLLLHRLLARCGVAAEFVAFDAPTSSHLVLQVTRGEGGPLILDASSGLLYPIDARELRDRAPPAPLRLPPVRELDYVDLRRLRVPGTRVTIYTKPRAGIASPTPAGKVETFTVEKGVTAERG